MGYVISKINDEADRILLREYMKYKGKAMRSLRLSVLNRIFAFLYVRFIWRVLHTRNHGTAVEGRKIRLSIPMV
ncbi:MAG: hypothetical protein DRM97_05430 [Thermoprotei archaeon]|nr:MAG: hypothetical protein DRM97_05430 [Thermoprotei archaeon]